MTNTYFSIKKVSSYSNISRVIEKGNNYIFSKGAQLTEHSILDGYIKKSDGALQLLATYFSKVYDVSSIDNVYIEFVSADLVNTSISFSLDDGFTITENILRHITPDIATGFMVLNVPLGASYMAVTTNFYSAFSCKKCNRAYRRTYS